MKDSAYHVIRPWNSAPNNDFYKSTGVTYYQGALPPEPPLTLRGNWGVRSRVPRYSS